MRTCSGCGTEWGSLDARWCGHCGTPLGDRSETTTPPQQGRDSHTLDRAPTSDAAVPVGTPTQAESPPGGERGGARRGRGWVAAGLVAVVGIAVAVQQTVTRETVASSEEAAVEAHDEGDGFASEATSGGDEPEPEPEPELSEPVEQAGEAEELASEPGSTDVLADPPDGWRQLPPSPLTGAEAELVWVGGQLLQVGGWIVEDPADAREEVFAFTPAAADGGDRWVGLGSGPFGLGEVAAVGADDRVFVVASDRAAVYSPSADRWRELPDAPFSHTPFALEWTGEELIAWGDRRGFIADDAIYDPRAERWRPMAEGPLVPLSADQGEAVWTGEQLVVVARGGAAAYDPHDDAWTELPPSGLSPQAVTATATDGMVVAYDYLLDAGYYDLAAATWNDLPSLPLDAQECYPDADTLTDGTVVAFYCGQLALLDPSARSWEALEVPEDDHGSLLISAQPVVAPDGLHLLSSGSVFGRNAQHWHYQP